MGRDISITMKGGDYIGVGISYSGTSCLDAVEYQIHRDANQHELLQQYGTPYKKYG